jgi:hypothetical protein
MLPIFGRSAGRKPLGRLPDELTRFSGEQRTVRGLVVPKMEPLLPSRGTSRSNAWIESGSYHRRDE